jgi:hypothetical protein
MLHLGDFLNDFTKVNLSAERKTQLLDSFQESKIAVENAAADLQGSIEGGAIGSELENLKNTATTFASDFANSGEVKKLVSAVKVASIATAKDIHATLGSNNIVNTIQDQVQDLTKTRDLLDIDPKETSGNPHVDEAYIVPDEESGLGPARYLKNPLEKFISANYQISLGVLSNEELADPDNTYIKDGEPLVMILRSGGGTRTLKERKALTAFERVDAGGRIEYFIEDLEINSVVAPNPQTRTASYNKFSFKVIEPYSMGQFLETLQVASIKAGHGNYIGAPFLLILDWVGYDDDGKVSRLSQVEGQSKRYLPIQLTNADFTVTQSGSEYNMRGIAFNDQALTAEVQQIPTDITLSGGSVHELLQSGSHSLTTQLNTTLLKRESKDTVSFADEYMITFPNERASEVTTSNPNEQNATTEGVARSLSEARRLYNLHPESSSRKEDLAEAINLNTFDFDTWAKKILGISVVRSATSESLKDFMTKKENINSIGNSTIMFSALQAGATPLPPAKYVYNAEKGIWLTSLAKISTKSRDITFKEKTHVNKIIEEIVLISDFGRSLAQREPDAEGNREWFKIETQVFNIPVYEMELKKGRFPKLYVFRVVPYKEPASTWTTPTEISKGVVKIKDTTCKQYNYVYTGKNKDVINFDIKFEYRFLTRLTPDKGENTKDLNNPGSHATQAELAHITNTQQTAPPQLSIPAQKIWKKQGVKALVNYSGGMRAIASGQADELARQFHDATVNHPVDLMHASLTIWGDPYFISDSGLGNYNSPGTFKKSIDDRGQMRYQDKKVYIDLNFRTPFDYNQDGTMQFPTLGDGTKLEHFSGLYWVREVTSNFNQGKFQQELKLIRLNNQQGEANAFSPLPTQPKTEYDKIGNGSSGSFVHPGLTGPF